jgi:hypothetical protein
MRETSALLYGIIIAHGLDDAAYEEAVHDLINSVKSKSPLEAQHGCLLASAHALERRICIMKKHSHVLNNMPLYAVCKEGVETIGKNLFHLVVLKYDIVVKLG